MGLAKALHLQRQHGWARFVSMQDHYNLPTREEEREMIPLCLDEGVGTIIWSPLARGRLARPWEAAKSTARAETDGDFADLLYSPLTSDTDHAIIDAVGVIAAERSVPRAQVALAWLHNRPVVTAPLVGANTNTQIDDAVASLEIKLINEELAASMERGNPCANTRASLQPNAPPPGSRRSRSASCGTATSHGCVRRPSPLM
jgi:1-deoxyxylulose-5-phosphate synthase